MEATKNFYTITAKKTTFRGIRYRSALEARWARFFSKYAWKFEYEPVVFRGWKPDFRLFGSIYVEVKPFDPWSDLGDHCFKAMKNVLPYGPCLLVGLQPTANCLGRYWIKELNLLSSRMKEGKATIRKGIGKVVLGSEKVAYHKTAKAFDNGLSSYFGRRFSVMDGWEIEKAWSESQIIRRRRVRR